MTSWFKKLWKRLTQTHDFDMSFEESGQTIIYTYRCRHCGAEAATALEAMRKQGMRCR